MGLVEQRGVCHNDVEVGEKVLDELECLRDWPFPLRRSGSRERCAPIGGEAAVEVVLVLGAQASDVLVARTHDRADRVEGAVAFQALLVRVQQDQGILALHVESRCTLCGQVVLERFGRCMGDQT